MMFPYLDLWGGTAPLVTEAGTLVYAPAASRSRSA
jgi:hypothetical protein